MGSLDMKSNQKALEPDIEISSNESEPMVDSPTTSDKDDLLELMSDPTTASDSDVNELTIHSPSIDFNEDHASCSSSSMSSSDFILEEPFQDSESQHGEKTSVEIPPIQVMERPTSERYRIPSSVFARKESINTGWGMPSNESLFSINMGGMSFRNQDSLVWRSGDLDLGYSIEPSPCGTPIEVGTIPELDETGETSESDASDKNLEVDGGSSSQEFSEQGRSHKLSEEDKIQSLSEISKNHGPSIASEPVSPIIQDGQGNESVVEELNSHFAAESGDRSSFAFPILTANTDKGTSSRITNSPKGIPQSAKSEPQLETRSHSEPKPEADKETNQSGPPKADPPPATWTNCFGCCTSCS
uniref:uncharacterized protein LOC122608752 n=1 Tax=Erigeron canadensis TaxID=72917 RepID=UPI001CB9A988|nr:uncharacterized protein LOC122608752 [Erigeron canadensis]